MRSMRNGDFEILLFSKPGVRASNSEPTRSVNRCVSAFRVNPPTAEMWVNNSVACGTHTNYHVSPIEGTLSIKTVRRGSATWHADGRSFRVDEDSFLILNAGQTYSLDLHSSLPVQTFCLFFRPGFAEEIASSKHLTSAELLQEPKPSGVSFQERLHPMTQDMSVALDAIFKRLETHIEDLHAEELFIKAAALVLERAYESKLQELRLDYASAAVRAEVFTRLTIARDYMLSNLDEQIRLADIASAACLSTFHFHRLFTAAFNVTPHVFLSRRRMARAKRLLISTADPVDEIAYKCGWTDANAFTTQFRKLAGISPGAYRRSS